MFFFFQREFGFVRPVISQPLISLLGGNGIKEAAGTLTVLVFVVCASDLPVREHLDVEADANVAVKPPQPFDPQQVLSIPGPQAPLLMGPVAQRPSAGKRVPPAAENSQRSKAAKQKDPVEEELHVGPCRSQEPSAVYLWSSSGWR